MPTGMCTRQATLDLDVETSGRVSCEYVEQMDHYKHNLLHQRCFTGKVASYCFHLIASLITHSP